MPTAPQARLLDAAYSEPVRLAWQDVSQDGRRLRLIAGKLLTEREQMLGEHRFKLWVALSVAALAAFAMGWWVSQRAQQRRADCSGTSTADI